MLKPFYNEEAVVIGDETYRLVVNFKALDAIESLTGKSFNSTLDALQVDDPPLGLIGRVLWGLLREHHADVTLDQTASLMFGAAGVAVGLAVFKLLEAAFPAPSDKPEAKGKNPQKPRGASKLS